LGFCRNAPRKKRRFSLGPGPIPRASRIVHHEVPPRVEYYLTEWGQALCPAFDALLMWAEAAAEELRASLLGEGASPGGL